MPSRIEDYAMIGDLHTAAIVGADGSVDWLCFPRFDSPACFAALLGADENARWRIAPTSGGRCTRRRYRGHTLILETEWETAEGVVRVIDCMPPRGAAPDLVRVVEGVSGRVPITSELRLRFDYGHIVPWVTVEGREVRAVAGPDALWLRASAPHEEGEGEILSRFSVSEGERVPFVLTWSHRAGDLHPGLRFRRARRLRAAHTARRVSAIRRREGGQYRRDDPRRANRRRPPLALPYG